jgi:PhnB protein
MRLHPHINFGGQCQAAFQFYEQCLGGKIVTMLTWGDSPMAKDVAPEWHQKICHATLTAGASELAGVDDPFDLYQGEPYQRPQGFQMILEVDQPVEAERIFAAMTESGGVKMPLQKTFWAARFGVVVDQFGVTWEINCAQAD